MRRGIEKLAYLLAREPRGEDVTLGDLAKKYDEPVERIMDALDVLKIIRGEPTQLPEVPWEPEDLFSTAKEAR